MGQFVGGETAYRWATPYYFDVFQLCLLLFAVVYFLPLLRSIIMMASSDSSRESSYLLLYLSPWILSLYNLALIFAFHPMCLCAVVWCQGSWVRSLPSGWPTPWHTWSTPILFTRPLEEPTSRTTRVPFSLWWSLSWPIPSMLSAITWPSVAAGRSFNHPLPSPLSSIHLSLNQTGRGSASQHARLH